MFYFCDFGLIYVLNRSRTISSPGALRAIGRPQAEKEDEITKMAEAIMDEAVTRLLNEAAEVILKEEWLLL
jgi:hypothetical protein